MGCPIDNSFCHTNILYSGLLVFIFNSFFFLRFTLLKQFLYILLFFCCGQTVFAQNYDQAVREKADAFYFDGVRQRMAGNHAEAYQLYLHTLELCPDHVGANYDISSYHHLMGEDSLAMVTLQTAADADPNNYWARQALVQLYVSEDKNVEAITELEKLAKAYPKNSQLLFMLEELYFKTENYPKTVETLDRIELLEGKNKEISTEKFRIYSLMKDEKKAFEEMRALAEEYPNDIRYQVLIGDFYLDEGKNDQALEVYEKIQQTDPYNINLLMSLARYYEITGQTERYAENLAKIVTNEALDNDTRVKIMQGIAAQNLFGQKNDTAKVMGLFDQIMKLPQENNDMGELYARYLISSEISKEKIKPVLYQMLDIDPEEDIARNQLLSYAIEEDDDDDVMKLCKTAVDYSSKNPMYYYYLSVCYLRHSNYEEAINASRKGLERIDDESNLEMIVNMYTILGDCYHRTGKNQQAFECYDSCLLYRPDDALVLNNYAYYLALEKKDLEKAKKMSAKAIQLRKDEPNYIDTYAWVLFELNRYDEAKAQIDKVLELKDGKMGKGDATFIEHAGDIYYKCGLKEQAIRFWQQAEKTGGGSNLLKKKIKKRKYIE